MLSWAAGKPVGTPDAAEYWRVASQHGVSTLFTAPTALRAIRQRDPGLRLAQGFELGELRAIFVAGERADPSTVTKHCARAPHHYASALETL